MSHFLLGPSFTSLKGWGSLLFLAAAACAPVQAQGLPAAPAPAEAEEDGTLQVSGQAQIRIPADRVTISLSVETESPSAREAAQENAAKMDRVMAALREAGGSEVRIETFGYSLSPEYRRPTPQDPSGTAISGYRARNNIRVILPGVDRTGALLDAGISAGANRVTGLEFSASDTRDARLEALREAVRIAREEAETIAAAMGVRLGPALEVRGGAAPPEPRIMARGAMAMEMASVQTPIEAGDQTVSANVTITYRIVEGAR